jgi:hypothetical protein
VHCRTRSAFFIHPVYEILIKPILTVLFLAGGAWVAVAILVARIRRRRELRREEGHRAPVQEKLLRPPGYSANQRVETLIEDFVETGVVFACLGAGVAGSVLFGGRFLWVWLSADPGSAVRGPIQTVLALVLYGGAFAVTLGLVIRQERKLLRLDEERENWRLGTRGEQLVGEALNDPAILAAGYRIYHDVPGADGWNIDHVVVGPGGVYVIETKARTKRPGKDGQPSHEVHYDGQSLRFPDWEDRKTLDQVKANGEWLRRWLGDHVSKDLTFHAIVVIPGWFVRSSGNYPVKVMNAKYLRGFLSREPKTFGATILNPVLSKLEERCRTLEV